MEAIHQADVHLSHWAGVAVGCLGLAVALDLTWAELRRVLRSAAAPGVGLFARFVILPAIALGVGMLATGRPSSNGGGALAAPSPFFMSRE